MLRQLTLGTVATLLLGSAATVRSQSVDLTGLWVDDTGGGATYRVRQIGNQFFWAVDGSSKGSFANALVGTINGNTITAEWADLPGSPTLTGGRITFRIESKDRFVKTSSTAHYGAQVWTRVGASTGTTAVTSRISDTGIQPAAAVWTYATGMGTWTGTWTQRGTSDIWDAVYKSGSRTHIAVERVTFQGRTLRAERLQSSIGELCRHEGTLEADNITYRGSGECGPSNAGWTWILERPASSSIQPPTMLGPPPSQVPVWQYEIASQSGWKGTWTKRGDTDIYDVVIQDIVGNRQVYVDRITFEGIKVRTQRLQSADRIGCNGEGTLQPDGITWLGVSQCASGPTGWNWLIRQPR